MKCCVSSITEYPASQWTGHALIDFLRYCAIKYKDEAYLGYFILLFKERLRIDLYKAATVDALNAERLMDSLENRMNIPSRTVQ